MLLLQTAISYNYCNYKLHVSLNCTVFVFLLIVIYLLFCITYSNLCLINLPLPNKCSHIQARLAFH